MSVETMRSPEVAQELNPLASLAMLRRDIRLYGSVSPETWRGVWEEEQTFQAEAMNLPIDTQFSYVCTGTDLVAEGGRSHQLMLTQGLRTAEQLAQSDLRHQFGLERARADQEEARAVLEFMRQAKIGDVLVTASPMPLEAMHRYGGAFVRSKGYQPERKMGFWYEWRKVSEQEVICGIQSVDNTDLDVFGKVFESLGSRCMPGMTSLDFRYMRAQGRLIDRRQIRQLYDEAMQQKYGGEFKAGRRKVDTHEAVAFIDEQTDLKQWYQIELMKLANLSEAGEDYLEAAVKKLAITFSAELKKRLDGDHTKQLLPSGEVNWWQLNNQLTTTYAWAKENHYQMVACGGVFGVSSSLENASLSEALGVLWSSGAETKNIWRPGTCRFANLPKHPTVKETLGVKEVGSCQICRHCQGLYNAKGDGFDIVGYYLPEAKGVLRSFFNMSSKVVTGKTKRKVGEGGRAKTF